MNSDKLLRCLVTAFALGLTACGSSSTSTLATDTSALNPNLPGPQDTGEPGGDTTAIAGLWDGTTTTDGSTDIVYWDLATDGVLTRYDYQQDGAAGASGENCYIQGAPINVTPEEGDDYSLFNVAITAVRSDNNLTITFNEPDKNDVDEDGDIAESPTYNWMLLTTPVLSDLNLCTSTIGVTALGVMPIAWSDISEYTGPEKPYVTNGVCTTNGGSIVYDIGDGTMFQPEYRCDSGSPPVAYVFFEGELVADEGAVCCV